MKIFYVVWRISTLLGKRGKSSIQKLPKMKYKYPFDSMQWNSDSKFCSGILSVAQIAGYELI